jgi:hypothetical protein
VGSSTGQLAHGIAPANIHSGCRYEYFTIACPLVEACLIIFVSGIPTLEANARDRWAEDEDYQAYRFPLQIRLLPLSLFHFLRSNRIVFPIPHKDLERKMGMFDEPKDLCRLFGDKKNLYFKTQRFFTNYLASNLNKIVHIHCDPKNGSLGMCVTPQSRRCLPISKNAHFAVIFL